MGSRVPHVSLLVKFSVLTFVCVAVLGAALAVALRQQILGHAASDARELARETAKEVADEHVMPADLQAGFGDEKLRQIDRSIEMLVLQGTVRNAKIYDGNARLVYSLKRDEIGEQEGGEVYAALAGETVGGFEESEDLGGRVYEVYTPLRFVGSSEPSGAFELYLPYEPIAARVEADTRRLYIVLAGGLAMLYLMLLPIVGRASGALRRHAAESHHQALHDELTGIANRRQLFNRLDETIRTGKPGDQGFALLMLDLDRFKEVNDALGHGHGDMLLRQAAGRLARSVRPDDLLARLGGDEFAVLAPGVSDAKEAVEVAERIGAALHQEFVVADVPVFVEASIGIALYPDHGVDAEALLQAADTAMYAAKQAGTRHELYVIDRDRRGPERIARLGELRRALAEGELVVYYQPKLDLRTGEVTGTEALVRWEHPDHGLLPPVEFLPLAEQTGLITGLTSLVLEQALRQNRQWAEDGFELTVAVNVSERSLLDPDFPDEVDALLARHAVPGHRLQLELTERSLIGDVATAMDVIGRLHALGVRLSVDDFGTGYSSLSRLLMLPLHELKIDRSFVTDIDSEGPGAAIVRSAVDLGHHLGLEVVAEGVETETTLAELRELGCDAVQGYHLLRPQGAAEVTRWLRERAATRTQPAPADIVIGDGEDPRSR
jgi:diguanylate cyclase (GGDEF)-like protein